MPQDIRLWKVGERDRLQEVRQTPLNFEHRLHSWLESDISIISDALLVIGSEVRTDYGGFVDLLCIDSSGDLVVIELKRDLTPREVVAQTIDYASWVKDLSHEQITEISDKYLTEKFDLKLEEAFQKHFDIELPDSLNEDHSLLVVASTFDRSSERIINYLSESYGVNINALTFQYFKDSDGQELIGRVFLIEPSVVQRSSRSKKSYKRKPNLTRESLRDLSEENGVSEIYTKLLRGLLGNVFRKTTTTLSSLVFCGDYSRSSNAAIFSLVVTESNAEQGLLFRCFTTRFAEYLGMSDDGIIACLPNTHRKWSYNANSPPDTSPYWVGHQGFFESEEDVERFLERLAEVKGHGS